MDGAISPRSARRTWMSDARGLGRNLQLALESGRGFPQTPSRATISVSNHPCPLRREKHLGGNTWSATSTAVEKKDKPHKRGISLTIQASSTGLLALGAGQCCTFVPLQGTAPHIRLRQPCPQACRYLITLMSSRVTSPSTTCSSMKGKSFSIFSRTSTISTTTGRLADRSRILAL
jgi:hypothetical protein